MVGHPGAAPGVSPSQAARISVFLVPEVLPCGSVLIGRKFPAWRFRRDSHSLLTRLTTVRLDDFGFGTHAGEKMGFFSQ